MAVVGRVAVVGAGVVGLSTAWFLQERGVEVTVLERDHVAAGSSWGNAGWLAPALTVPLPDPAVLAYGVRALLRPSSPVYVPLRPDAGLLRFLVGFARHSTARRWAEGMKAFAPVNALALEAFDELQAGGVQSTSRLADPFLACFARSQDSTTLVEELHQAQDAGHEIKFEILDGDEARRLQPTLSAATSMAVRLHEQRYLDPPAFLAALAESVYDRGGEILETTRVTGTEPTRSGVAVHTEDGQYLRFDRVVLANGAWLDDLARPVGVRRGVQPGRGYSFSVECSQPPTGPLYFPSQRVACTPLPAAEGHRLRVAGMMEMRAADDPLDPRRIRAVVDAVRPFLDGVDLDGRRDEWVGSRPCTADGLPLVGATRSPGVFVAGGHGMWGMALGPVTGRLLAEQVVTGSRPPALAPFDPLR